jgi:hypothetical protein
VWTLERCNKVPRDVPKSEVNTWQGDCQVSKNRIRFLTGTDSNERDTVWHEIKHAVLGVSGQGQWLNNRQEENIVSATTPLEVEALLQLGWLK